jgi:hypothetical protein
VPIVYTTFSRGEETLYVETAVTRDRLSRLWAESFTTLLPLEPVPLGQGLADSSGVLIDGGDIVVRAVYAAGGDAAKLTSSELTARTRQLLTTFSR